MLESLPFLSLAGRAIKAGPLGLSELILLCKATVKFTIGLFERTGGERLDGLWQG